MKKKNDAIYGAKHRLQLQLSISLVRERRRMRLKLNSRNYLIIILIEPMQMFIKMFTRFMCSVRPQYQKHLSASLKARTMRNAFAWLCTDHVLELQTVRNESLDFASHCTLKVPCELVDEYRKHPLWGQFRTIEAL